MKSFCNYWKFFYFFANRLEKRAYLKFVKGVGPGEDVRADMTSNGGKQLLAVV